MLFPGLGPLLLELCDGGTRSVRVGVLLMQRSMAMPRSSLWVSAPMIPRSAPCSKADRESRNFPPNSESRSGANSADRVVFCSFSLGDVFEREIQKHGRFAFRGKNTSADSSRRFVENFVRAPMKDREVEDDSMPAHQNLGGTLDLGRSHSGPIQPMYSFGTCMDDLYNHSWRDKVGSWL